MCHLYAAERKKNIIQRSNELRRIKVAKTNLITDLNLRIEDGTELFDLERKVNKKSAAYEHLSKLFEADGHGTLNRQEAYYGTIFLAYQLPYGVNDVVFEKMIKKEAKNPDFKMMVHCSTSFGKVLCPSVKKGGTGPFVRLLQAGYKCFKQTFTFRLGTTEKNKEACYVWQKWWKLLGILKEYFKKQFPKKKHMEYKFVEINSPRKGNFKGKLSQGDFDLAFEYTQTLVPLFPLPTHLVPNNSNTPLEPYSLK